jgi:hypothetical protein
MSLKSVHWGPESFHVDRWTDGQMWRSYEIAAFRNFAKAPKNCHVLYVCIWDANRKICPLIGTDFIYVLLLVASGVNTVCCLQ